MTVTLPEGTFAATVRGYLDTPTNGVPPRAAVERLRAVLAEWQAARADYLEWEEDASACRELAAAILGVPPGQVGLLSSVTLGVAAATTALAGRGGMLLAHRVEFRSLLLPALAAFGEGRVRWVDGPYTAATFLDQLTPEVCAVVVSAVSSHDGARPDLAALAAGCAREGAGLVVDATQVLGAAGLGVATGELAAVAAAGYKWLMAPRGSAYAWLHPDLPTGPPPAPSPYGMADLEQAGAYGPPLAPKPGGAGLDQSPAWFSWVGALPALRLLQTVPAADRERHGTGLADRFRDGLAQLGLDAQVSDLPSQVVSVAGGDPDKLVELLGRAGVRAAARRGRVRFGFHLYNTPHDADAALDVLASADARRLLEER